MKFPLYGYRLTFALFLVGLLGVGSASRLQAASVPAAILTQPTDQTVIELLPATFSVIATGSPLPRLQWFRNDQAIASATNASYTLLSTALTDEGSIFRVEARNTITNVVQLAVSSNAVLHITPDTAGPLLVTASTLSSTLVQLLFSEGIRPDSASSLAQYTILGTNGDLTVTNVAVVGNRILLGTTPAKLGSFYTVKVQGVKDLAVARNEILPGAQLLFQAVDYASQDVGNPTLPGSTTAQLNGYDLQGAGTDIGGKADQFQFNYQLRQGDFDVKVRVESLTLADAWTKAGLMARQTLSSNSIYAAAVTTPSVSGSFFQWRNTTNGVTSTAGSFPVNYPQTWLRLRRTGNTFTGFAGYDGGTWLAVGSATFTTTDSLYVGMVVSSRNPSQTVQAQFRDLAEVTDDVIVGSLSLPIEPVGPSSRKTGVAITEIMYHPKTTNTLEFVELYNSNPFFEDIGGWRLAGAVDYTFPPNTVMQGGAFLVVAKNPESLKTAYGISNVMGPYTNSMKGSGVLQLLNQANAIYLEVPYSDQNPWPIGADGTGHSIVLAHASYGEGFPQAWAISDVAGGSPGQMDGYRSSPLRNVVINEFLAHSADPTFSDYIELYNHSNQPVDLSGCILSDDPVINYFVIPAHTIIPARGFIAFDENQMGFSLKASGGTIYFKSPDLTRVLDAVRFEPQANGVSFGRYPDGAAEFYPLEKRTPGQPNGKFLIRDIVINELMYKPVSGANNDEYVELYNKGTNAVDLSGWQFAAGISFTFPSNVVLAPDSYLVVAKSAATLLLHYPQLNAQNTIGDYGGSLGNKGDRVALSMPEPWIRTSALGVRETNILQVVADEVIYGTGGKWGHWANEGGSSLELIDPRSNHRLPSNWADSDETAKAPWTVIEGSGVLDNGSGTANRLEIGLLGEGECLLDDAEVMTLPNGTNAVGNSTFEKGFSTWQPLGNHVNSTLETTEGYNSSQSMHIRSSARGDTSANAIRVPLTKTLSQNQTGLIRAKVRWLHGWPEIVMRLSGNFLEATGRFTVPQNLGTPGMRNSQALPNTGPAIYAVTHRPIVPAANEAVVVTARVHDPDGISALTLNYREDPAGAPQSITMSDDGTGGDAVAGDGLFSATIPGKPANTLVAFYVQATDAATTPLSSVFPDAAPTRECLVRFGDPTPIGAFATYRQWYTQKAVNTWKNRPVMSNERVEGTFVYNNYRVIYGHSAKYSGSPYHQEFTSPETSGCHYSVAFPLDDMLLGTENFNKIHAPGNGSFDDNAAQREQTCYWLARQLGVPWNYRRFVNMYFNGNRKGGSVTMMEDTQTPGTDVIDSLFPNDTGGNLYKLQPWFEFTDAVFPPTGAASFNNVSWCTLENYTTTGGVKKPARYRWNYLTRAAHGTANDYGNVYDLIDAVNAPVGGGYVANIEKLVDIEEWMRIFAVVHSVGDWDHFGSQNSQNMYGYKPVNGKWQLMIWDMNIVLGNSGSWGPGENLFNMSGTGPNLDQKLIKHPYFRRIYLRSLKELASGPMTANRVNPILDAKYAAMVTSGVTPTAPAAVKDWILAARNSILTQVRAEDGLNFQLNGTNTITTDNNLVILSGLAPVEIKTIQVNGVEYPVTWVNTKTWNLRLIVPPGTSAFNITGFDRLGQPLAGATTNLTIHYTGSIPDPSNVVVISEIMYNPTTPDASFVEIYNRSATDSFDLSQWRLRGVTFTFPLGTVLTNGQSLVVCQDLLALARAYSPTGYVAGVFAGQLNPAGETLTLLRPGLHPGEEIIVNRVRYEARLPWPQASNGQGPSLQLIDAAQDNSRVSNWHGSEITSWRFYSYTGVAGATRLSLQLDSNGGDLYLDDLSLVQGSVAGAGDNLIVNAGFESPNLDPWISAGLGTNSQLSSTQPHSGANSLHLLINRGTPSLTSFYQDIPAVTSGTTYTLSFWYLPGDTGSNFNARLGSAFKPSITIKAPVFTPGAPNTYTDTLPPYPPLWLNELQANNTGGFTDSHGESDPWIELYNAGTNTLSLDGFYLASTYSNLTEWPFPAGGSLAPGQFKVLFADGQPPQSTALEWHTSFRLADSTGSVALVRLVDGAPQILDYFNYSGLTPGGSYGSYPDGQPFDRQAFYFPTPGAPNNGAGPPLRVFINEWMASNTKSLADPAEPAPKYDDWFELYNAGTSAADLTGYFLTDTFNDKRQFEIPAGYPIPPKGYLLVWADNEITQNSANRPDLHVNFQLSKGGEQIGLYTPDGVAVDTVSFGAQTNDISQGRWPDGAPAVYFMPTPTPRSSNVIPGHENTAPVLTHIENKVTPEINLLTFQAHATDADQPAQELTFSLGAGAPTGASITPDGQFRWRPLEAQGPNSYDITVRVTDNGTPAKSASQTFQVRVQEVNIPPYFINTQPKYVKAGSLLTFATAADADLPPQILTFTLLGAPVGAKVDPVSGLFSWTPAADAAAGTYPATVRVSDNGTPPYTVEHTYSIQVTAQGNTLVVVAIKRTGNSVQLSWETTPGKTYRVTYKDQLSQAAWKTLGNDLPAAGSSLSVTDTPGAQRIYRVSQVD